jgi:hypothetical protein
VGFLCSAWLLRRWGTRRGNEMEIWFSWEEFRSCKQELLGIRLGWKRILRFLGSLMIGKDKSYYYYFFLLLHFLTSQTEHVIYV